jgi:hypothetical protein
MQAYIEYDLLRIDRQAAAVVAPNGRADTFVIVRFLSRQLDLNRLAGVYALTWRLSHRREGCGTPPSLG